MTKPFSQACENNRDPILKALMPILANRKSVLEIGSGTGQHAVWFGAHLDHLDWHTSDRIENHRGIELWLAENALINVHSPLVLDVIADPWPTAKFDAVFSANTSHIMSWQEVEAMFKLASSLLFSDGVLCLYGPFRYGIEKMVSSNQDFDTRLKAEHSHQGIRSFESLDELACINKLVFLEDKALPANNRLLAWQKA